MRNVLRTWGSTAMPTASLLIQSEFLDVDNGPLSLHTKNSDSYIRGPYGPDDLRPLGVRKLTAQEFLEHVGDILDGKARLSRGDDVSWHTQLARAINALKMNSNAKATLRSLPIIPLLGGGWGSAEDTPIYFPGRSDGQPKIEIPAGIQLKFVDPEALTSKERRNLFRDLDVKEFDSIAVFDQIRSLHCGTTPSLTPDELLSHARFLYDLNTETILPDIYMATKDGKAARASTLYFPSVVNGSADVLAQGRRGVKYSIIHPAYLSQLQGRAQSGERWMHERLKIQVFPRLVISEGDETLHGDFLKLIKEHRSRAWLSVLRAGWESFYGPMLHEYRHKALCTILGSQDVECQNGKKVALQSTYMAVDAMDSQFAGLVPFLDVPNPRDREWHFLTKLGVCFEKDHKFYVSALESMSRRPAKDIQQEAVAALYERIQACITTENTEYIRYRPAHSRRPAE